MTVLVWVGTMGVPAVALIIGGLYCYRKSQHGTSRFFSLSSVALGALMALYMLIVLPFLSN